MEMQPGGIAVLTYVPLRWRLRYQRVRLTSGDSYKHNDVNRPALNLGLALPGDGESAQI